MLWKRSSVTKSQMEKEPTLRGKWKSVFSGKHMDNVPKGTHVVSHVVFSCSFSHDTQASGNRSRGQRRKGRSSSPASHSKAKRTDGEGHKSSQGSGKRIGRPDILWSVNKLAHINFTSDYRQYCQVGNAAQHCIVDWGYSKIQTLQEILKTQNQHQAEFCAFLGVEHFAPNIWMCKKQTSVSHSSTESEIVSLDAGLRMDRLPPGWQKPHAQTVVRSFDMEGMLELALRDTVNWQTRKVEQLYNKVSHPCQDDHQFKQEELESVVELSEVCSQIDLNCLYLARIGRPDILWSVNNLARSDTKWTQACDKRLARLISYFRHADDYRQHCHVENTAQHCRLWLFQDSDFAGDLEDSK